MPSKRISFLFLATCILSCHQTPEKKLTLSSATEVSKPNERQKLIKALQDLKAVFASSDPDKIGNLIQFPAPDSVISPIVEDTNYVAEKNRNNNELTRDLFNRYFKSICEGWQLDQMNQLFRHIPLQKLNQQDTISYFAALKNPCLKQYFISVDDSLVTISYGTNHNDNYRPDNDDDESGDACEYDIIWQFRFDGETLHLIRQMDVD